MYPLETTSSPNKNPKLFLNDALTDHESLSSLTCSRLVNQQDDSTFHSSSTNSSTASFIDDSHYSLQYDNLPQWRIDHFCSLLVAPSPIGFGFDYETAQELYHYLYSHGFAEMGTVYFNTSTRIMEHPLICEAEYYWEELKKRNGHVVIEKVSFLYKIPTQEMEVVGCDCSILKQQDGYMIICNNLTSVKKAISIHVNLLNERFRGQRIGNSIFRIMGHAGTGKTTCANVVLPFYLQDELVKLPQFKDYNFHTFYYNFELCKITTLIDYSNESKSVSEQFKEKLFKGFMENTHFIVIFDEIQLLNLSEIVLLKELVTDFNAQHFTMILTGGTQSMVLKNMDDAGNNPISLDECSIIIDTGMACTNILDTMTALQKLEFPSSIQELFTKESQLAINQIFGFVHPAHLNQILSFTTDGKSFTEALNQIKKLIFQVYERDLAPYLNSPNGMKLLQLCTTTNINLSQPFETLANQLRFSDLHYFFLQQETGEEIKVRDVLLATFISTFWTIVDGQVQRKPILVFSEYFKGPDWLEM